MNKRSTRLLLLPVLLLSLSLTAQNTPELYLQTSEMNDLMTHYRADKGSVLRFYSNGYSPNGWAGREQGADYNSPERRQRLLQLIQDYDRKMAKVDFNRMNVNGKVDYLLFQRNLQDDEYELKQQQLIYDQVKRLLPFSERVYQLEKPRRRGLAVRGDSVAREMNSISKEVNKAIKELKSTDSLTIKQAEMASAAVSGLKGALKTYFDFYNGYDPLFTWWVPATHKELDSLLGVYASEIKKRGKLSTTQKEDKSGIVGSPIGREEIIRQLKMEFIAYTPDELIDIANREFAWCDAELLKATKEMGFGTDWKAAQEKVKNTYVEPGRQPQAMLDLYQQSLDFLKKNDLVTVPPLMEEDWKIYMMSPAQQLVNPFFLGGESLIVSYPTNTMSYDDKMMSMRGNNPHFSRATVHHELIAGHHMQMYMMDRYKTYRQFYTPFWVEGNSLYWELLLWDLGFARSPEDRIGMLFWRMHRCARIIFSLNYHIGKWTPQECIDFLVDRVGHERANAEGEVRRSFTGGYGPLYQIAYMIGGLQFYSLKKELVDTKKMSYKQYHDAILHENSLPIELLRVILTNQDIKRDFKTNWKFYEGKK